MNYDENISSKYYAGNTWEWEQYASGWTVDAGYTLTVSIINLENKYTYTSATYGSNGYVVSIPASTTSGYTAGNYGLYCTVSDGTDRYTVAKSQIQVLPDILEESSYDIRTTNEKIRDAISDAILGVATANQLSMSIAGRSISRIPPGELIELKKYYDGLVAKEKQDQKLEDGNTIKNKIRIRYL